MKMKLQTKLTGWFVLLLLLMGGGLLLALYLISGRAAGDTAQNTLRSVVGSCVGSIDLEHGRLWELKVRSYEDGVYLQVYSEDGSELLSGTDVFEIAERMPEYLKEHADAELFQIQAESSSLYVYARQILPDSSFRGRGGKKDLSGGSRRENENAEGIWVVGILPEEGMDNLLGTVFRLSCLLVPCLILLAALGGWLLAGASLRPLRKITESAREITDGADLSRRIELGKGKDEVQELAKTFNEMMGRLEKSFEAERQFTSDASHELRTPTSVILAECDLALQMPEDAEGMALSVEEIRRQARKMSELIAKLLSYTRLEQGSRRIEPEELDLSEMVEDICEEQRLAMDRNVEISCEAQPQVRVQGDLSLLISLVQNLVTNAVKYNKDPGKVYVSVTREKGRAFVSVRDEGIGISQEDLPKIWNRFYQAEKARSEEGRGVGLGLSLARRIAELHGGEITVRSEPGKGSEFVFSMPALS